MSTETATGIKTESSEMTSEASPQMEMESDSALTVKEKVDEVQPKRVTLPEDTKLEKSEFLTLWEDQERYIDHLETKLNGAGCGEFDSSEADKKMNPDQEDVSKREHLLVCRLAIKEQELQELSNQVAELKAAQAPSMSALRNALLDPAVNIIIQNLKKELEATKKKMQETQEELSAWKFTPDSVTGKRLMSKCRQLLQENEDLGKMISSGRLAKLESELAMQKALCEEMKKNQVEMDDFVQELDEDVEGMQSTIYFLQQQLKEAKDTIANLEAKLATGGTNAENIGESAPKKAKKSDEAEDDNVDFGQMIKNKD